MVPLAQLGRQLLRDGLAAPAEGGDRGTGRENGGVFGMGKWWKSEESTGENGSKSWRIHEKSRGVGKQLAVYMCV